MLCVAAFIVFIALFPVGMFFPEYRKMIVKSWHCVVTRIQLKPCDISFGDELKNSLVSFFAYRAPWMAKFILKTAEFWAWVFILVSVWSIWSVAHSGLNLLVYDTCDPFDEQGCALGGDSCGIGEGRSPIWKPRAYFTEQRDYYIETFQRIPDVFRRWNPEEFTTDTSTFQGNLESDALVMEILDPGCIFCRDVWENIQESNAYEQARVTYLLYPIPLTSIEGEYRFPNSFVVARVIEALKEIDLDWEFLDLYFASYQEDFAVGSRLQAREKLAQILEDDLGLFPGEVEEVLLRSESDEIEARLRKQRRIVEEEVKTYKIPTLFVGQERFDRVVEADRINQVLGG